MPNVTGKQPIDRIRALILPIVLSSTSLLVACSTAADEPKPEATHCAPPYQFTGNDGTCRVVSEQTRGQILEDLYQDHCARTQKEIVSGPVSQQDGGLTAACCYVTREVAEVPSCLP